MTNRLRHIPSVEKVLQALGPAELPRPLVTALTRRELGRLRDLEAIPPFEEVVESVRQAARVFARGRIQPVINATGIVIHTNLGRSPLPTPALKVMQEVGAHYSNLEFDLESGERGTRASYLEHCLALLCESPAAAVVNNCAAALVLALHHFTRRRREVVISRGELVQIGGGFRVPEILEASGAVLREVGTTNRTTLRDYEEALGENTGLILKVHRSNFFMGGFVESPRREELGALARGRGIPFLEDLGSGAVARTERLGLPHEPTPAEVLRSGAGLVCFSGDKLFGGPQAGILAGGSDLIEGLKKDPFYRAVRCDKLILSALQTVAEMYLTTPEGIPPLPVLEMLRASPAELRGRAERLALALQGLAAKVRTVETKGQPGGGTLPEAELDSIALEVVPEMIRLEELSERMRRNAPPVIGCIQGGAYRLDLRTVFPEEDELVREALAGALA